MLCACACPSGSSWRSSPPPPSRPSSACWNCCPPDRSHPSPRGACPMPKTTRKPATDTTAMPYDDLAFALRAEGYKLGPPGLSADALEIDREVAESAVCEACGHEGC